MLKEELLLGRGVITGDQPQNGSRSIHEILLCASKSKKTSIVIFPKDTKLRKPHQKLFSVIQWEELGLFLNERYKWNWIVQNCMVVCLRNGHKVQLCLEAHWGKVTVGENSGSQSTVQDN